MIGKMASAAKGLLRKEIAKKLELIPIEERKRQSEIVKEKLFNLPEFQKSKRVSVFLSLDTEIDTEPIVRKIFEDGKECFVPRYSKAGMQMVKLKSMEDWETLPVTKWNIKQPSLKDNREDALQTGGLDFIVSPGVAFTKKGGRLGHGGGYYDRFFKQVRSGQSHPVHFVGVAFKEQILEEIPLEETDVIIDKVLYAD
ncbi:5-formyltetrahydrofolate cyclo-ligase isoform X2 [Aethina tumida]|nr:5-formyltetrahydrofolate cyclo-ligase isoform X2 [Aethina tumida]